MIDFLYVPRHTPSAVAKTYPEINTAEAEKMMTQSSSTAYDVRSDFELKFGRYLPSFKRADGDDTDKQRD